MRQNSSFCSLCRLFKHFTGQFVKCHHFNLVVLPYIKHEHGAPCHSCSSLQQFVPFRDYMDRTGNHVLSMARLAKDVLAEIPDQFISYMKSRGIKPNPAPPPYTPPGHTHHHTQI